MLSEITIENLFLITVLLTLPVLIPDKEEKLTKIFNFTIFCASKCFMKALKAFIKPFEATKASVDIKI